MRASAVRFLREPPTLVPTLVALGLFVAAAAHQGGYPVSDWAPGALVLLALLLIVAAVSPARVAQVPRLVLLAAGALAAYTGWSYASIAWAGAPGDALAGANRTLLYLVVFLLFALWPQRGRSAVLLVGAWTLAMTVLALVTTLRLTGADPRSLFVDNRLSQPTGYPNAAAATWMMAVWPALALAATARMHWLLRGLFAAATVLLGELSLLSLSRGALFSTPIVLALFFIVLPGRPRAFAVLVPIVVAIAAAAPTLLHVGTRLNAAAGITPALHAALRATLISAAAAGLVVALGAIVEGRLALGPLGARRAERLVGALGLLTAVLVVAGGLVALGDPGKRAQDAWHSFKRGYAENAHGSRLVSGLGSNRYDFYRVALSTFADHPLAGVGADNFAQAYLARGRSEETPNYPHSVELRALVETGVVGTLLLSTALLAAALVALRVARAPRSSGRGLVSSRRRAAAGGALFVLVYWLVQGSFDWFWEFAGLGGPAFGMLGLACALAPRRDHLTRSPGREPFEDVRGAGATANGLRAPLARWMLPASVLAALGGLAGALALGGAWLADRNVAQAAHAWPNQPQAAYSRLTGAAREDPFSDRAYLVAGTIALRLGDLPRADRYFAQALTRTPQGTYALLERGAIASARGDGTTARRLLARAVALAPRDPVTRAAWELARRGQRIDIDAINGQFVQAPPPPKR